MPPKHNPAKLNPLQLRTLTLLQAIARIPGNSKALADGSLQILQFPHAHGDHFHLGEATVRASDATGLNNQAVWTVLERKGLAKTNFPQSATITAEGLAYDTGIADEILHHHAHH